MLLTKIGKYYVNDILYKYFKQELKTFEIKKYFEKFNDVIKISKIVFLRSSPDAMIIFQKILIFVKRTLKTFEKISCIFAYKDI